MSDPIKQKVKILISYDGTDFEGWQRQAEGQKTIQQSLETALSTILNEKIMIIGSGRTDSGVHAEGQVAHFWATKPIPTASFYSGVNSLLPHSIAVLKAWRAPKDFHAQQSAISKTYRYLIYNSPIPNPLRRRSTTWLRRKLSVEKLNEICQPLAGTHDFKSFRTSGTDVKTTVRTITELQWFERPDSELEFRISGTGFLKQMIRNIVGTALDLHQLQSGAAGAKEMLRILEAQDRREAKASAPPTGLYLHRVDYPPELDINCLEI
jgi:tRNA pseudouridine38-40 synthase